jgi:ubiquinone biosynthesis protein UbiJ
MLERALNRALARALADSPRAQALCAELAGRTLVLRIDGVPGCIALTSDGGALTLRRGSELRADASLSGGALSLLALAGADAEDVIRRGDVRIDGDAAIAERFRELARLLRPNVEAGLARVLGPLPAHLMARSARGALAWTRHATRTAVDNVAEYLAHESRDLVPRAEAEDYLRGVEALREQVDRMDARVRRLEQQAAHGAGR